MSLQSRLARSPEDDASSRREDARIKYDGINIDDACPRERVQLEVRGKESVKRVGKRERRRILYERAMGEKKSRSEESISKS